jgi:hypothetical protein
MAERCSLRMTQGITTQNYRTAVQLARKEMAHYCVQRTAVVALLIMYAD